MMILPSHKILRTHLWGKTNKRTYRAHIMFRVQCQRCGLIFITIKYNLCSGCSKYIWTEDDDMCRPKEELSEKYSCKHRIMMRALK